MEYVFTSFSISLDVFEILAIMVQQTETSFRRMSSFVEPGTRLIQNFLDEHQEIEKHMNTHFISQNS